jgi:pilus assembly protein CpaB
VAVNEVAGVAGFLSPNNKVDVVVTTQPPGNNDPKNIISKIVLQNVPILATGQITEQKEGKPVVVPTVTIDLTPEDAEKLVVASSQGKLQLLLRGIKDSAPTDTKGANISKVLGTIQQPIVKVKTVKKSTVKKSVPKPVVSALPPAPVNTLEIIKGTNKTVKQY